MKNFVITQDQAKEANNQTILNRVLITDVTLKDGSTTQIVTLFNWDLNFENVHAGIMKGLLLDSEVVSSVTTSGTINNGTLTKSNSQIEKVYYTDEKREQLYRSFLRQAS